jgi:hypothetical protein
MSWMAENVGASNSRKLKGLHGLYRENFTFTFLTYVRMSKNNYAKIIKNNYNVYQYHWVLNSATAATTFFSVALLAHSGPRPLIQFRNHFSQTAGLNARVISSSQGLYLNTGQSKHRINAYTRQTSTPWVGFELTIPASERAKTVHALDSMATMTG